MQVTAEEIEAAPGWPTKLYGIKFLHEGLVTPLPPKAKPPPPAEERRRSQRLPYVMPVKVGWRTKKGEQVWEYAESEVLNAHGAVLRMKICPPTSEIELNCPLTGKQTRAWVVWVGNPGADGLERIAIELVGSGEAFWGITFPPPSSTAPG